MVGAGFVFAISHIPVVCVVFFAPGRAVFPKGWLVFFVAFFLQGVW
jgi:hypothetical protein